MTDYEFKKPDFDHPSFGFILEDKLKSVLGGPLLYNPYYISFNLKGDESVLDFGCGGGAGSKNLIKFLNRNGLLTCVDTSKYWIKKATNRLKGYNNVDIKLGDIRELKIPAFSFDVISIIYVIHDIAPSARQDTILALNRTLKKGGTLFIREPTRRTHGMPVQVIRTLLSTAGLTEVEHETKRSEYIGKFQK
jgi:ubiquinone/menaquinone biosynthesis C-methylase UbiE